ncbi:MAG TPA: hypothetical protein PLG34_03375 [Spirochaetota bacterium]|jgi:hypothetical protein|nr:MAG: hypothetical protein BWX91_00034 [Spirochaetes bacterium ADurb.Bin133]HNZ25780.1 hypothetical protein [Spirochaetota bacterium]HPY87003.1 hypothetical protein [Spirochaetota bacterium]HQB61263.1 hypothetical protein [Spirochaetota bacterium]
MKKLSLIFILLAALSFSAVAEDAADSTTTNPDYTEKSMESTESTKKSSEKSFFAELENYIGKNIVVYISDVDVTVRGELLEIFSEGLYIRNIFKVSVFVSKSSISYIELRNTDAKKN